MADDVGRQGKQRGEGRWTVAALAAYAILAIILTYPLLLRLGTHIPGGDVDEAGFLWNTWWLKHALLDLHTYPFTTDLIFSPLGMNLTLNTMAWLNCMLALPLTLTLGPIVATNALFLFAFVLSSFGMYLLALDVLRDRQRQAGMPDLHPLVGRASLPDDRPQRQAGMRDLHPLVVPDNAPLVGRASLPDDTPQRQAGMPDLQAEPVILSEAKNLPPGRPRFFASLRMTSGDSGAYLAAFIAGVVYAFASGRFLYAALGHYNFVSSGWLPLAVLFLVRTVRRPGWRAPILAGTFWACAGLTEFNFIFYLALFAGFYFAYALLRHRSLLLQRGVTARLGLALLVFLVGFGPLGLAIVGETLQAGDYLVQGWGGADRFLLDLLGPLVPSTQHPLFGAWARTATSRFSDINFGFVGYLTLLLAAIGAVIGKRQAISRTEQEAGSIRPAALFWLFVALAFFVLALGPLLHINGQADFDVDGLPVNIPLPYIVIHYLPVLKAARVPGRFAIMATLAVAVLVAFGAQAILRRLRGRWQAMAAAALALVILAENMALPIPLTNVAVPEPYRLIAQDSEDSAVMQIPLGWREGFGTLGRERTLYQAYQIAHGKPLLSGQTARSPAYVLPYFAQLPVLGSIAALEEGREVSAAARAADHAQAAAVLAFLNVRYVVVHGDYIGGPVDDYIRSVLPVERMAQGSGQTENSFWHFAADGKWVETRAENTGWILYTVRRGNVAPVTRIDVADPAAPMHLAAGWSRAEQMGDVSFRWVEGRQALALLRLDQPSATSLSLRAAPFSYPGAPVQGLTVTLNDYKVGYVAMQDGWREYRLPIPAPALKRGINQIQFSFAHMASPSQVLGSSDERNLAAAVEWIKLE